jgi:CheY-like chemotaxis protein
MAEFLKELDHEVTIARTASEMWAALTRTPAAVVVLDLGLPDEDGFNVIPRMRQLYPEIGLLVLTGRVAFDHRILGLQAVGQHVSELSNSFAQMLEMGAVLEDVAGTIHVHPTLGEAFHEASLRALGHAIHI